MVTFVYRAMRTDMKDLIPAPLERLPANKKSDSFLEAIIRALRDGLNCIGHISIGTVQ